MSFDERDIIKDIAARRGLPEKVNAFRRMSPSNKYVLIGGAVLIGATLVAIYAFSKPRIVERKTTDTQNQLIARLMPRDEVTPGYIDTIGESRFQKAIKSEEKTEDENAAKQAPAAASMSKPISSMMIYTSGSLASQLGSLGVPMGTELKAFLEKTVITDERAVPVIARITDGYSDNGVTIIPRNSRLFGATQGMVEDRVNVRFSRIVFPDGKEHAFSGVALDSDGVGGVEGNLKKKHGRRGRSIVSSAIIGASGVFAPSGAGFSDTAVRGAQRGAAGELMKDSEYYRRTEAVPIVTIRAKTPLTILVDRAV